MAILLCCLHAPLAWAQQVPAGQELRNTLRGQPNVDAGTLLDYNRKTLEAEEKKHPVEAPSRTPEVDVVSSPEDASASEPQSAVTFTLQGVQVHGVSALSDMEIQALITPFIGTRVTLEGLQALKEQIQGLYLRQGYLTSRVFLPPQEIVDGVVHLQVVEGRIADVEISGLRHLRPMYITSRLNLIPGGVFQLDELEQALNRLNQTPLVRAKATIKPGQVLGESVVVIEAQELKPWQLTLFGDNQGRQAVGLYRSGVSWSHGNVLGFGDRLDLNALASLSSWSNGGSQSGFATYAFPLGRHGVQVGAQVSMGHSDIGGPLGPLDINGRSYSTGIFASGPVWRKPGQAVTWELGLDSKRALQFLNEQPFPELGLPNTDIRLLRGGLTWQEQDRWGQTFIQNQVSQGIEALGGRSAFFKYTLDASRVQSLWRGALLIGRLGAQLTPDNLVAMEQFQIGGAQTVRGYQEGTLIGDQGYFGGLELRVPLSFFAKQWPQQVQLLGFFEAGAVGLSDTSQADATGGTVGNIRSLGMGIRTTLGRWLTARLDSGFAFTDNQSEPTARIHFGLSSSPF